MEDLTLRKRKLLVLLMILESLCLFSGEIELNKIRFIIDGDIYNWKKEEVIPKNSSENGSQPKYLATFFRYTPGDILTEEELVSEVEKAGYRLKESNLFYISNIKIVPPKKYPNKRTVVIKVKDGFRYRFGGGSIYGQFGQSNIKGEGYSINTTLGINRADFNYRNDMPNITKGYYGFGAEYDNSFLNDSIDKLSHDFKLKGYIGRRVTPDLSISVGSNIKYSDDLRFTLTPGIYYRSTINFNNLFLLRHQTSLFFGLSPIYLNTPGLYTKLRLNEKLQIGKSFTLALQLVGGVMNSEYKNITPFNLLNDPKASVRGKYSSEELSGSSYILKNSELRFKLPSLMLPPIFNINPSIFIYSDIAQINKDIKIANGVGARLYFDNPIFTGFTFLYGWNSDLEGQFKFTATIGF